MAGVDRDCIRAEFSLPDGIEVVAAIAAGWPGDPESLPERYREREKAPRERKSLDEMVFGGWSGALATYFVCTLGTAFLLGRMFVP
jgi:hypothetical protein